MHSSGTDLWPSGVPRVATAPALTAHRGDSRRHTQQQEDGGAGSVARLVALISTIPALRASE